MFLLCYSHEAFGLAGPMTHLQLSLEETLTLIKMIPKWKAFVLFELKCF